MNEFHFLRPYWFLALLPLGILLWQLWHRKYHSRSWRAVCDAHLLPYLLTDTGSRQQRWPILVVGLMSLMVILALAGPTWEKLKQPVFREQSALVIVLDLSRSMDAADVKPSRLARARHKVIDILKRRKEGQTALLVYAAEAYTVSPLTDDSNTIVAMVKTLNTQLMPVQGSAPDKALQHATDLLKQAGALHGHVLLITDGIIKSQAKALASLITDHGHQLSVLGVGTAEGAPISIDSGGFLKDRSGDIVVPKLNSTALTQLARLGGGRYHSLMADETDLNTLLAGMDVQRLNAQHKETSFIADRWHEQGPWLLLLVLPFAALVFRKGYLAVLIIICLQTPPQAAIALEWDELWQRPDQKAAKVLQQNPTPETLPPADVFNDSEWKASAHYRAGQYQQAAEVLQGIDKTDALYNKGNALAKMGKLPEAIQAYEQVLKNDPAHADAKYNREQVEKKLQQQKKDSGESEQDQNKSSDDKQQEDKNNQQQDSSDQQNKDKSKDGGKDQQDMKSEQKDEQQKSDQDKAEQKKQAEQDSEKDEKDPQQQAADLKEQNKQKEIDQASAQWLRRIPDDPGGLLRRKFQYEHQRQQQRNQTSTNNDNEQPAW